ncbi:MAG TPA: FtsX-like permease family protein [Gemmatimonadales bacterium]|nr:FtsX-like permease family protein [Gemmatimonadales bacterium]
MRPLTDMVAEETATRVTQLRLLGTLCVIALLIAGLGIHGLLAFTVARRAQEIGIRRALGERAGSVVRRVLREGLALALAGIGVGVWPAYLSATALRAQLAGVGPGDPTTFAIAAALCLVTAAIGCLRPVVRAARVDPMTALRQD